MTARMIRFSVDLRPRLIDDDGLVVAGRCTHGPLRIGDMFTHVFAYDDVTKENALRIDEQSVDLRIERMTAYRHDFDELDEGMTAEILIRGKGRDLVKEETFLGTEQPALDERQ